DVAHVDCHDGPSPCHLLRIWEALAAEASPVSRLLGCDAGDQSAAPAAASSRRPKTRCVLEKPAMGNSPSSVQPSLQTPAKAAEATTVRESLPAIFSSLAARLTAGPMQVKSSRLVPPILPNSISPIWSATPKRKRSLPSPRG